MCPRKQGTLVVYDDSLTAGLGYSARLLALALLVAVQERRVLVMPAHRTARWCGRAPHTLGCYYEPLTHCDHRAKTPTLQGHNLCHWRPAPLHHYWRRLSHKAQDQRFRRARAGRRL